MIVTTCAFKNGNNLENKICALRLISGCRVTYTVLLSSDPWTTATFERINHKLCVFHLLTL